MRSSGNLFGVFGVITILRHTHSWFTIQYNGIITGAYIVFYQGRPIDHCTHVPGPVDEYISESEYNAAYTAGMALSNLRILNS